jgi:hypothetical protein
MRSDPGACPVCGVAHAACTPGGRSNLTPPFPAGVGLAVPEHVLVPTPPLQAEIVQATLPPTAFTTGTYRRKKKP